MARKRVRAGGAACLLGLVVLAGGCHRKRKTVSQPKSDAFADQIKSTVAQPTLKVMHWPNYADYQPLVQKFYDDRNYEVAWVGENGQPSAQANAFIKAFQTADAKGLKPEDYDAELWSARVAKLAGKNQDDVATYDAAMTVSVMRYISDLRIGRVNPTHFNFDIDVQQKKYDLPEFVSDNAVDADDVPKLIASVEPDSEQYRGAETALVRYEGLARQQADANTQPLPDVTTLSPGGQYSNIGALTARLQLEGDLPGGSTEDGTPATEPIKAPSVPTDTGAGGSKVKAAAGKLKGKLGGQFAKLKGANDASSAEKPANTPVNQTAAPSVPSGPGTYTRELADAVKHYQQRHGINPDGKLNASTIKNMNVPLSVRSAQLADSLERLRWLPNEYLNAPLQVNLPEFMLRGFGSDHEQQFQMNVVVGQVIGQHQTPVFTHMMKYLIFRPYWNVPMSIVKKELTGHIEKSGVGYLESKNFETTDRQGQVVKASASEVEHGQVLVREKPGPKNSLGLVKFMFPNEYDIYLHSTPAQQLFARSRRDFSHGCVRVEHPDDLAAWVLKNSGTAGDWDLQKVQDAMQNGPDNHQVNLAKNIPIVIFYATARVAQDGSVDFFDDIYGYDRQLEDVLSKGMPYPSQQQKVNPNTQFGDTT
ncbi:MAG: L,D-transpeptidase family protein [Janthinobacterium lividum]